MSGGGATLWQVLTPEVGCLWWHLQEPILCFMISVLSFWYVCSSLDLVYLILLILHGILDSLFPRQPRYLLHVLHVGNDAVLVHLEQPR